MADHLELDLHRYPLHFLHSIPALTWNERYKYLGCPIGAFSTPASALNDLRDSMLQDCSIVF